MAVYKADYGDVAAKPEVAFNLLKFFPCAELQLSDLPTNRPSDFPEENFWPV
jgi:hypothetical protein